MLYVVVVYYRLWEMFGVNNKNISAENKDLQFFLYIFVRDDEGLEVYRGYAMI